MAYKEGESLVSLRNAAQEATVPRACKQTAVLFTLPCVDYGHGWSVWATDP